MRKMAWEESLLRMGDRKARREKVEQARGWEGKEQARKRSKEQNRKMERNGKEKHTGKRE